MESFCAGRLLHDPGNRWRNKVLQEGTLILTGMRGCGKTMLLRSIDWQARAYRADNETEADVIRRLRDDTYVGLFVSCASLMRGPRPNAPAQVFRRLLLAYAIEVVRFIQTCQVLRFGSIDYHAVQQLQEFLADCAPWYKPPTDPRDPFAFESALLRACNDARADDAALPDPNPRDLFDAFTTKLRQLSDLLARKKVLLLLDDVSVRFLSADSVNEIFGKLCFQSTDFAFKLSSESQTITMTSPGGGLAQLGRDYEMFDLGDEVFDRLRSPEGLAFVEEILRIRLEVTDGAPRVDPCQLLGRQSLMDIARAIRHRPREDQSKKYVYWGLDALAGICVGDVGDILFLFDAILAAAPHGSRQISKKNQHTAILNFAEDRLRRFAVAQEWMHTHAMAFAQASHGELVQSSERRIRQYAEVFIKIESQDVADTFPKILKLIEEGVFVPTGGTPRTKQRKKPFLQLKLAYRKLWGLTSLIPLSMKDRVELSGASLNEWVHEPSVDKLLGAERKEVANGGEYDPPAQQTLFDENKLAAPPDIEEESGPRQPATHEVSEAEGTPDSPQVFHTVETLFAGSIRECGVDWPNTAIIAGLGFEDRSVGAWKNLLGQGRPSGAILLEYSESGDLNKSTSEDIVRILTESGIAYDIVSTRAVSTESMISGIRDRCVGKHTAIDTTSLTKPLIYGLVADSLCSNDQAIVLHTCAEEYFPCEGELERIVTLLSEGEYARAIRELDVAVSGELGPYSCIRIGETFSDPTRPTFLAAFISLKYSPVAKVLERGTVEELAAIFPLHSTGEDTSRSIVGRYLADYFAELYHGRSSGVGSLDHSGVFERLMCLYSTYALEKEFNFEISLTGTKMHAVAVAMFASVVTPANIWYSRPGSFDPESFTRGTADTRVVRIRR